MRKPKMARSTAPLVTLLTAGAMLLGACSGDIGSPTGIAPSSASFAKGSSHFNPGKGNKDAPAEGEVKSYTFVIDPRVANTLNMGSQVLEMPANSVCDLESDYGPGTWKLPCASEVNTVKITAKVTGTKSGYPIVDFHPSMRFNPAVAPVQLFMFAKRADATDARRFSILYCSGLNGSHCIDEALTDGALVTKFSTRDNEVFRQIRHFSGYVVAERGDGGEGSADALQ